MKAFPSRVFSFEEAKARPFHIGINLIHELRLGGFGDCANVLVSVVVDDCSESHVTGMIENGLLFAEKDFKYRMIIIAILFVLV
mmetsp:Transcript_8628/g.12482  ORF Transcript_8628/g.12482 Transcript_8628/m.12482 type:complete len:84 (+) Transcript_8628:33-284(+)